jgi:hypothetical protein
LLRFGSLGRPGEKRDLDALSGAPSARFEVQARSFWGATKASSAMSVLWIQVISQL